MTESAARVAFNTVRTKHGAMANGFTQETWFGIGWQAAIDRHPGYHISEPPFDREELKRLIIESLKYDLTSPDNPRIWLELRQALDYAESNSQPGYMAAAVIRYGEHEVVTGVSSCAAYDGQPCNCGFDEAVARAERVTKEKP
jgi:hypothetical protein